MQNPRDIDAYWQSTYPDCAPVAHWLRDVYRDRWVRFHSLPGSKRYADDESDYRIILERHNAVLGELAAPGEELVFVSTSYSGTSEPARDYSELIDFDPTAQCWRTIAMHELENDDGWLNYWHLFMSVWTWKPGIFDGILRLVADNIVANTMILSTEDHWIYHPYDGGADVVLHTTEERLQLKQAFPSWLSLRRDGL